MSRRRGEFEHRTSIFEGAFRAWSHLGGLVPELLETSAAADLDPLTNPIENDSRLVSSKKNGDLKHKVYNPDGSARRDYPYEPLPRSGLAHPYVQAILSPWLGPDADNEAIQLGLTTLRTWWQHRRKGESGSAVAALGTEKMKGVVEGYTRHFFTLAHCLVVNDREQPPRTLHGKIKELEKKRSKRAGGGGGGTAAAGGGSGGPHKKRVRDNDDYDDDYDMGAEGGGGGGILHNSVMNVPDDAHLSPLERLHLAQRRQLEQRDGGFVAGTNPMAVVAAPHSGGMDNMDNSNGVPSNVVVAGGGGNYNSGSTFQPILQLKNKCVPGAVDLPAIVDAVTSQASQLVYAGGGGSAAAIGTAYPNAAMLSSNGGGMALSTAGKPMMLHTYGDPNTTPVVFVSPNGCVQIALTVEGITCAHCVKIVETVLKGCNGNKSPIEGLLDAAADFALASVLIRIDKAGNAKRVAFEAARNLAMVGYMAQPKEMSIVGQGADKKATMDLGKLSTAFEVVANTDAKDVFDWSIACTCPDNGVVRGDCDRHSQMNKGIFEAFESREKQVEEYMAGCGMRYGMDCTCGPGCRCKNCPVHKNGKFAVGSGESLDGTASHVQAQMDLMQQPYADEERLEVEQPMFENFGIAPPSGMSSVQAAAQAVQQFDQQQQQQQSGNYHQYEARQNNRASLRNPSIISYGNGLRGMSITSETTFGRAMSGLSALSIDWENLQDFDVEVDHSAGINAASPMIPGLKAAAAAAAAASDHNSGSRRSSFRRSYAAAGAPGEQEGNNHVSFKV